MTLKSKVASTGRARMMIVLAPIMLALFMSNATDTKAQHVHGADRSADTNIIDDDPAVDVFVREAREATKAFHQLESAIAAGYQRMGPDMPNMGEHWIHPRMVVQQSFDPARPSVLTYLRVGGNAMLTGVAYTQLIRPGESPSPLPFEGVWHYHSGNLEEEAFGHAAHEMTHDEPDGMRLGMIHAWIWVDNPDGLFSADNWALPFVRIGVAVPPEVPPSAGKAMYLLDRGIEYYARMVELVGRPSPQEREIIHETLAAYQDSVRSHLDDYSQPDAEEQIAAQEVDVGALTSLWIGLWEEVAQNSGPELRSKLSSLME